MLFVKLTILQNIKTLIYLTFFKFDNRTESLVSYRFKDYFNTRARSVVTDSQGQTWRGE